MSRILMFPGQGSQRSGMGQKLAEAFVSAREVFEEVDDALDRRLFRLMRDGSDDEIALTQNAQPALMASSIAVLRVLESESGIGIDGLCDEVAGHSLGEYSAHVASGSLALDEAARLLELRGIAMQKAVPRGHGRMAAVLGLDLDVVHELVEEISRTVGVCALANDNSPAQVVISGDAHAVEAASDRARSEGARRIVELAVSAPFHCPLMQPAAEVMEDALRAIELARPQVNIVPNVTAAPENDPVRLVEHLVDQVTQTVRWRETMIGAGKRGVECAVELGTGTVLFNLVRRNVPDMSRYSVETPDDVDQFLRGAL